MSELYIVDKERTNGIEAGASKQDKVRSSGR